MSKVLVDRELLRDCSAELSDWRMSFPNADSGMTDRLVGEIDAILAQPAEAEGVRALDELLALFPLKIDKQAFVVNGGDPLTADGDDEFLSFKKVNAALGEIRRLAEQGRAALSAVTAERDQLRAEVEGLREALARARDVLQIMRQHEDQPNGYKYPVSLWFPAIDAALAAHKAGGEV